MSNNINHLQVLLIGAGPMAVDYAKVLLHKGIKFITVGRGQTSAQTFSEKAGVSVILGGLAKFIDDQPLTSFTHAIVATGVESLAETTLMLLKAGVKNILVEKPAGLNLEQIDQLRLAASKEKAGVFIAYNRRFYSATHEAKKIIDADGGITSFNFDFTEWSHVIEPSTKPWEVKRSWLLANSSHVIDLAFYLGGAPTSWSSYSSGELKWHSKSIFAGSGVTGSGALFNYGANWESAGRWGVEINTLKHKLILRPMEQLFIQKKGSIEITPVDLDEIDKTFKPGLYKQTSFFLEGKTDSFPTIEEQYNSAKNIYLKILGLGPKDE